MVNGCQSDNQLNAEDWFSKGLTSEKAKDYVNAIKAYTKALEINPRYAIVYQHRGSAWTKQNDYDQAIIDFTEAIRLNPSYAEIYNLRGMLWSSKNMNDLAMIDFTKAIEVNPRYADAFNNRAVILARKGNYDQAIDNFTKALEIDHEKEKLDDPEDESGLETFVKKILKDKKSPFYSKILVYLFLSVTLTR